MINLKSFKDISWIKDLSLYSLPAEKPSASDKDAFMLGGDGYISARMGMQPDYSTMDRIMGPFFDSYNGHENNLFQMDMIYPYLGIGYRLAKTKQFLWRVRGTSLTVSKEVYNLYDIVGKDIYNLCNLYTINFVHPILHTIFRIVIVKNNSKERIKDLFIAFDARPDTPWVEPGYNSEIGPSSEDALLEKVTEYKPEDPFGSAKFTKEIERKRYLVRGVIDGKSRGMADLSYRIEDLKPNEERCIVHYLALSLKGKKNDAKNSAEKAIKRIKGKGVIRIIQETKDWWDKWNKEKTIIKCADKRIGDAVDSVAIMEKVEEHHTGGFSVIDSYTQCFARDSNGPHLYFLRLGKFEEVKKSMDFFYRMDILSGNFRDEHLMDYPLEDKIFSRPHWYEQEEKIGAKERTGKYCYAGINRICPGDVPNFRILWYWWYYCYTGDSKIIKERFNYLKALLRLQEINRLGYLADYCCDETYGIGPIRDLRVGRSLDNSFILLAAVQSLAEIAKILGRNKDYEEFSRTSEKINQAIEKLWLKNSGYYAMRRDEKDKVDPRPCSPGLLRALWVGAKGDNKHIISSTEYVLKKMHQKPGFIYLIPKFKSTIGHIMAYLLYNLCKIDHPQVNEIFEEILLYFCPSGTSGEYYSYGKDCPRVQVHRARCWESGVNTDAIFYYLTGFEPDACREIVKLKPHLPKGLKEIEICNMRLGDDRIGMRYSVKNKKHLLKLFWSGNEILNLKLSLIIEPLPKLKIA